jgi:tetratricopeptide (TPR) repeat protein
MQPLSARFQLALSLQRQGQFARAIDVCQNILDARPDYVNALHLAGILAVQVRDYARALDCLNKTVAFDSCNADAAFNRAIALKGLGQLDAALAGYDRAINLRPTFADAYANRGVVLQELWRIDEALESYDKAIALKPDLAHAYANRGFVLTQLRRLEAAVTSYDRAIALNPQNAKVWLNRGNVFLELGDLDAALESYERTIAIRPDCLEANVCKSIVLLTRGEFEEGWGGYEWRLRSETIQGAKATRAFGQPRWSGEESIAGKTLLLHCEQGLGDTIQFCRYAKLVAQLGAKVILEVQRPLVSLLKSLAGVWRVVEQGESLPNFDLHCPLLSLPLAFKTSLATIPSAERYLEADACKLAEWRARVGADGRLRVGLAWSGNKAHPNDGKRSIALAELLKGLPEEHHYVSLHKEVREADMKTLEANPQISHFAAEQTDFSDAAALCACMDLVISVDTSIAHLSAALGQRTWILLPLSADWRWLLEREDSPWYPSVKLFRQVTSAEWGHPIERLALQCRNLDYRIENTNKR